MFFYRTISLEKGIGAVYVMIYFICNGCLELSGLQVERELQNEKFLPTVEFGPGAFRLRSEGTTTELREMMSVVGIKVHPVLSVIFSKFTGSMW